MYVVSDSTLKFGKQKKSSTKVANLLRQWVPKEYEQVTVQVISGATAKDILTQLRIWVAEITGDENNPERVSS